MIKLTKMFKALGNPTREEIMRLLRKHNEMNVGALTSKLHLAQPTVSQHLKILLDAGVLKVRKDGNETYYSICSTQIFDMIDKLLELYRGEPYKEKE
ncbi:MAG TPA: metalloregulator ArsR/SmtB family transcription factor [Candidatus Saccharimonadales bacterium]|nr:metalloregulator ArsR/SmtB family transcription factor [Candidatus Saccharimonadales bacterium]